MVCATLLKCAKKQKVKAILRLKHRVSESEHQRAEKWKVWTTFAVRMRIEHRRGGMMKAGVRHKKKKRRRENLREEEVYARDDRRAADGTPRRRVRRVRLQRVGWGAGGAGGAGGGQEAVGALGAAAGVRARHEADRDAAAVRAAQLTHRRGLRGRLLHNTRSIAATLDAGGECKMSNNRTAQPVHRS